MREKNTNRSENQKSFRINGSEYIAEKRNAGIIVVGEICAAKRQPKRTEKTDILFEKIPVTEKNASGFWWKDTGYGIKTEHGYIRVMQRKIWPLIIGIVVVVAILCLICFLLTRQNPAQNTIDYIGDKTGIVNTNSEVKGEITGYTSFESVQDQTWSSASKKQPILLKNLKNNPVDLCPSVYLDLNKDGKFAEDECVWTAGNGSENRIAPGSELKEITLDHTPEKGSYDAQVIYHAYMHGTDTPANGMNFAFKVTVD
ncbi:hypothetical protein [Bilifractor sp. HCP3S3_D3]|uniref:hypothetical protein n=1 Tax=Bilifractor sp. HCP3S3_D3 TaxID=3438907 RepID=UPI003F89E71E